MNWLLLYLVTKFLSLPLIFRAETSSSSICIPHFVLYRTGLNVNGLLTWPEEWTVEVQKKKIGAGHKGRTLYLDKEDEFNSANCPWQIHDTLQCAGSHFVVAMLPMPIASSTALSGWNPQVSMLTVWLKEKKEKINQVKTQAYCWHKNCAAESCQSFCEAGVLLLWISLGMV